MEYLIVLLTLLDTEDDFPLEHGGGWKPPPHLEISYGLLLTIFFIPTKQYIYKELPKKIWSL